MRSLDAIEQDEEGILTDMMMAAFVGMRCGGQIKHDLEMVWPAEREVDVTAAAEFEALDRGFSGSQCFLHDFRQAIKPFKSYSAKQIIPAVEVTVGSVVGDTCTARDLTQGEGARADFADEGYGGIEQRVAEIGMMVGFCGHRLFLSEYVDTSNIQS